MQQDFHQERGNPQFANNNDDSHFPPRGGMRGGGGHRGMRGDGGNRGMRGDGGYRGMRGDGGNRGMRGDGGNRGMRGDGGNRGMRGDGGYRGMRGDGGQRYTNPRDDDRQRYTNPRDDDRQRYTNPRDDNMPGFNAPRDGGRQGYSTHRGGRDTGYNAQPPRAAGRYTDRVDSVNDAQQARPAFHQDPNHTSPQQPQQRFVPRGSFSSGPREGGRGGGGRGGFSFHNHNNTHRDAPKDGFYRQQQQQQGGSRGFGRQGIIPSGREMLERQRPLLKPSPHETELLTELTNNIAKQSIKDINATIDTEKCIDIIEENDVTFITTETGTGKSTVIPHAIAQKYPSAMILITEPRRMSAIQLAQRVASLLDVEVGEEVGYSVRGEHCGILGTTRIMYITSYSLLLYLIREPPTELPFDFLILDEFHERPLDIQVSAMLIRELMKYKKLKPSFKLVLSSATVGDNSWKTYFSDFKVGEYSQCKEMFQITNKFAEDVCKLSGSPFASIVDKDDVSQEQLSIVLCRIYQLLERIAELVDDPGQSILVFLPGRAQVEQVSKWIEERYSRKYYPVMWHGEIELSVIEDAIKKDCAQKTKVYLATDIAEVSLTLPDVVFVIDSCMNKRKKIDYDDPASVVFPPLKLFWETTTNARQRRGRVGRVRNGIYMSMLSQEEHNKLAPHSGRQYSSGDLDSVILHTLFVSGNPEELLRQCCEPPDQRLIQYSLALLQREGFIVSSKDRNVFCGISNTNSRKCFGGYAEAWENMLQLQSENGLTHGVTLKGFITAHVPAMLEYNTMVFFGCLLTPVDASALLAATAAAMFPFSTPFDHDRQVRREMIEEISEEMQGRMQSLMRAPVIQNDLIVSAHAVLEFMSEQRKGLSEEEISAWCEAHSLIRSRVVDAVGIYNQMVERLGEFLPLTGEISSDDLSRSATLLHVISVASNASRAVSVTKNDAESRRVRYNGEGIIVPFKCGRNEGAPSLCQWSKGNVCLPMTMFPGQDKYLGSLTAECSETQLYIVMLLLTSFIQYTVPGGEASDDIIVFRIIKNIDHVQEQVIDIECEKVLGQHVLVVRMMLCLKLAVMHAALQSGETQDVAVNGLKDGTAQFPPDWLEDPLAVLEQIPTIIEGMVLDTPAQRVKRIPLTRFKDWEVSQLVHFSVGR